MVFDCMVYGVVDGKSNQMKFGENRFVYTYNSIERKIVLKTIINNSDRLIPVSRSNRAAH